VRVVVSGVAIVWQLNSFLGVVGGFSVLSVMRGLYFGLVFVLGRRGAR
jgi:hypothetical protein